MRITADRIRRDGDRRSASVRVAGDWPAFAGHFPGEPVLPGVDQLGLVLELARASGRDLRIAGLRRLRLRRPVRPEDVLDIALDLPPDPSASGPARFTITSSGEPVSRGDLDLGEAEPLPRSAVPDADARDPVAPDSADLPSPAHLLPHGPVALQLDRVLEHGPERVVCRGRFPDGSPFARDGRVPAHVALEMAAQATGVCEGIARAGRGDGPVQLGYLVGVRTASIAPADLPADEFLRVTAELEGRAEPLGSWHVAVHLADHPVLTADLSTYAAA